MNLEKNFSNTNTRVYLQEKRGHPALWSFCLKSRVHLKGKRAAKRVRENEEQESQAKEI